MPGGSPVCLTVDQGVSRQVATDVRNLIAITVMITSYIGRNPLQMTNHHPMTNRQRTRFIGYSCPEIVIDALLEITVSKIKSKIPCIASFSYGLRCNKASYSIFSLIISEYAWYSSIPSIASSFSSVIDKITSFVNAVYQHKNNTPDI